MVQQFVDHFKAKEYGFNFFPALGVIVGTMLAHVFMLIYNFLKHILTGRGAFYFSPMNLFYSLLLGVLLVLVCHLLKDDAFFTAAFSLAYAAGAILIRLFSWATYSQPEFYYGEISIFKTVLNPRWIINGFVYALALALALFLFYLIFKRLDYALPLGFLAAEFFTMLFNIAASLATESKPYLAVDYVFFNLLEAALLGFFFYLGYTLYMRAKGWRLGRGEVSRTEETTAPRTRQLSVPLYFGLFLTAVLVGLICFIPAINRGMRARDAFEFSPSSLPLLLHGSWIIALSALGTIALLLSAVIFILFIYKMWGALQDGRTSTPPLQAALLLLVPLFNLYWIFKAVYGFAQDYNRLTDRHRLNVPKLPVGLYLAFCTLVVLNAVGLGLYWVNTSIAFITSYLQIAVGLAVMYLTCQAVNRIPAEIYGRPPAGPLGPK